MAAVIDNNTIEEIRARVDIVELIRERVEIKKAGSVFKGCCPFHNEKTPSFTVSPTRQSYKCFGCGAGGDAFKFVMEQDGLTFIEAVRRLADRVGVTIEEKHDKYAGKRKMLYALHAELSEFYQRCLKQTKGAARLREYLSGRQIDEHTLDNFSMGYAPARPRNAIMLWANKKGHKLEELEAAGIALPPRGGKVDWYDRFQDRLMFPIRDAQGRVVAFSARIYEKGDDRKAKYVNSPETEIFTKGRVLYGLDKAASKIVKHPRREAIICEGQIDVIRCHSCGFETAVASQGTAFSKDHVKLLKRYADCVVLVFDGDAAGKKAAVRTGALLLEAAVPVRVAELPSGEDPDSFLCSQGYDKFKDILEGAASIIAFQISAMQALEDHSESIDAVSRLSHGVIETLAGCTSSVLSSSLLQEAADVLHLPLSALEDDLAGYKEKEKKRKSFSSRNKKDSKAKTPKKPSAPKLSHEAADADEPPPLPDGPFGPPVDEDGYEVEYVLGSDVDEVPEKEVELPCDAETLLCELLIEHEHDISVMNLVIQHLPLDVIRHPFVKDLVRAVVEGNRDGSDRLAQLYRDTEPEMKPLFASLLNHKHKMLGATEATPDDATKDIIRRIWMIYYRDEQGGLPAESTPKNDMKRLELSILIKRLQTGLWKDVQKHMITSEAPIKESSSSTYRSVKPEESSDAAPSVYEEGSAYACSHPDESQSSEYPPDEKPDL